MQKKQFFLSTAAAIGLAAWLAPTQASAQTAVAIDNDDIGGVVTGPNGPEAGVWVIAETNDLPTRFARSVVTDDQGRYVVPDLPKAKYKMWVRGYGLVNSPKVDSEPGKQLNLTAVPAPNEARGGAVLSGDLLVFDAEDSGSGPVRRQERHPGEREAVRLAQPDEEQRLRRLPSARPSRDPHDPEGVRRLQDRRGRLDAPHPVRAGGRAHGQHRSPASSAARPTSISATGPTASPRASCRSPSRPRPAGVERNVVVTTWDWADEKHYLHDLAVVGQAQPDGQWLRPGVRLSRNTRTDRIPILDPVTNKRRHLHGAGARRQHADDARTRPCRDGEAAAALGLLG